MRVKKTSINTVALLVQNFTVQILGFICRTVFINTLGSVYLGVNGLFSNIFDVLSLMELGVGTAITYYMYKPLAEKDKSTINGLMILYAKFYKLIGVGVAVVGVSLMPFLKNIVGKTDVPNLNIIYLLLLSNVVIGYFLSYPRSLFAADQRKFVTSVFDLIFLSICDLVQIAVLVTTKNFLLYLSISIVTSAFSNICIRIKAKKDYPYLSSDKKYELPKDTKKTIFSRMMAAMSHNIGGVLVFSTDNILLSVFSGVVFVGLYSNYNMIVNMINTPLQQIYAAMVASVGNLNVTESKEKSKQVFDKVFFLNFWLFGFCSLCLWFLLNPFIKLWVGDKLVLNEGIVLVIVINFYLSGMRLSAGNFIYAAGLFWNTRFKPLFEAAVNLVASIGLAYKFGAIGVFMGTCISILLGSFWIDPYVLYKKWFKISSVGYFVKYGLYTVVVFLTGVLFTKILYFIPTGGFWLFVVRLLICVVGINLVFIAVFCKTKEYKYFWQLAINLFRKKSARLFNK